jgi:hypothetical protein
MAWVGSSIFIFVLGMWLQKTNKNKMKEILSIVAPIFGIFELVVLFILLISGVFLIANNGLLMALFLGGTEDISTISNLKIKLLFTFLLLVATFVHYFIAFKTNTKTRTKFQNIISRTTSMLVLILNFIIVYFAILLRDVL